MRSPHTCAPERYAKHYLPHREVRIPAERFLCNRNEVSYYTKKSGVAVTPDSTNYLIHHSLPTTVLTDRFQESGFNLLNRLRMRTVPLRYILFPLTPYLNSMLLSISLSSELLFSITKKEQPSLAALLGEGIFTMGYSKNYI